MRRFERWPVVPGIWVALAMACLGGCALVPASKGPAGSPTDVAVGKVFPALVRIHVVTTEYQEGREQKFEAAGSGTIISPAGDVLTNYHVVGKAKWIRCTLADKDEAEAVMVGKDPLSDIAVIKLIPSTMRHPVEVFPYAEFGDSSKLRVGDRVLAMGSPLALSQSVTSGIVSNTEMTIPSFFWGWFSFKLEGEEVGTLVRWIGHDAKITGGNSGGPLVDLQGRIVGVNEIQFGLSGAIPSNLARAVADELMKNGEVRRSWLGFEGQPLLRGSPQEVGVLVGDVAPRSPAQKAGIRPGDVVTDYNGQTVQVRWAEELPTFNRLVLETPIGASVRLGLLRDGRPMSLTLVTEARGKAREEDKELLDWGATLRDITPLEARELKKDHTDGVLVTSVRPGGACGQAKPALDAQDVIVRVGDTPVKNLAELTAATEKITAGKKEPVPRVVVFERRTERMMTVVKLGPNEGEDNSPEVRKAWFPASVEVFSEDLAEAEGLAGRKGVLITEVYRGQAAEKAGFQCGDILTHVDGLAIEASQPEDADVFPTLIRKFKVGARAEVSVIRDGKEMKIALDLPKAPVPARALPKYSDKVFEFTGRDLAFYDRIRDKLSDEDGGVYVEVVEQAGWAALAKMAVGDLLISVGGTPVSDTAELEAAMQKLRETRPKYVTFFVKRGAHSLYLELEPDWNRAKPAR